MTEFKEFEEKAELNLEVKTEPEEMFEEIEPYKLVQANIGTDCKSNPKVKNRKKRTNKEELTFVCDGIVKNEVQFENYFEHFLSNPSTSQDAITQDVEVADVEANHSMDASEVLVHEDDSFSKNEQTYTEAQQFKCDYCGFRSIFECVLASHLSCHSGEKLLDCKYCDRKFTIKAMLDKHERTHKGEEPFGCSQCSYRCWRKVDLARHIRFHNGDKPLKCYLCHFGCTQKSDLSRHVRTHTGEKPFKCSLCPYRAARNFHLSRHVLKVHQKPLIFS